MPAQRLAINEKFHFRKVGIYFDRQHYRGFSLLYAGAVNPVAAGDVQHGNVLSPGCLVVIVHVFWGTIRIYQSFVVDARHRFITQGGGEIDEVPVRSATDVGRFFQYGQVMLQVLLLILDAEIESVRLQRMYALVRTCTVFADNHGVRRKLFVLFCQEAFEACKVASIPALIQIPADNIGNIAQSYLVVTVAAMKGHSADTGGVFFFQNFLQTIGECQCPFQHGFQFFFFFIAALGDE